MTDTRDEPDVIYLPPRCHDTGEGREWCVDDVWGPCEDCGAEPVKYVRADAIAAERAARERAEALLAEADWRVIWESFGLRRDFQEDVEAVLGKGGEDG